MNDLKMPDINNVIIAGSLTKDPVIRKTTNGTPVTNFTIACNRKFRDNLGQLRKDVCYIGVVAWYKLAEICSENLLKGYPVIIDGELQSRSWKTENGHFRNIVEIKARRIQFLNKKDTSVDISDYSIREDSEEGTDMQEDDSYNEVNREENQEINDNVESSESSEASKASEEENKEKFNFGYEDLQL